MVVVIAIALVMKIAKNYLYLDDRKINSGY